MFLCVSDWPRYYNVVEYMMYEMVSLSIVLYCIIIQCDPGWTTKAFLPIHFSALGSVEFTIIEVSMEIGSKSFSYPGSLNWTPWKYQTKNISIWIIFHPFELFVFSFSPSNFSFVILPKEIGGFEYSVPSFNHHISN